jgi:branched-chain amino acid transport system substrate-binding protein
MTTLLHPTRRGLLMAGNGAGFLTAALPGFVTAQAAPIKLGFQLHRTGIGAAYGRWYERTATAALKRSTTPAASTVARSRSCSRMTRTDPKRGAEVVDKLTTQSEWLRPGLRARSFQPCRHRHAPRAGELKVPYLVCSEGYHVASALNRWTCSPASPM